MRLAGARGRRPACGVGADDLVTLPGPEDGIPRAFQLRRRSGACGSPAIMTTKSPSCRCPRPSDSSCGPCSVRSAACLLACALAARELRKRWAFPYSAVVRLLCAAAVRRRAAGVCRLRHRPSQLAECTERQPCGRRPAHADFRHGVNLFNICLCRSSPASSFSWRPWLCRPFHTLSCAARPPRPPICKR